MSLLVALRHLFHGSDKKRAIEDEREVYRAEEVRHRRFHARQETAYSSMDEDAVEIGHVLSGSWPVRVAEKALCGHMGIWGPSGSGKSYLLIMLLRALVCQRSPRLIVLDPKEETIALMKRALVAVANALPEKEAERLLKRVVFLDLFSKKALPRFQVLRCPHDVEPELHADSIAHLITSGMDQDVGVRQEAILVPVLECLIRAELPLTVLPLALENPELLERLAAECGPAEFFRQTARRVAGEPRDRKMGLVSRVDRLVRLRSARLAFGGSQKCLDIGGLLDRNVTLVNVSSPHGSADIGRFMAGNLWLQLSHAIRRRPNGSPPAYVAIDEFPTFLAAGGSRFADTIEDLLRLARSKGVYLYCLSQDMTSVAKISSSLPDVMRSNLHIHAIFRSAAETAWDFALPVTGQKPVPTAAPWEKARSGYLSRSAELCLLRQELSRLPDRECYFVDRRTGVPGVHMRTKDLILKATEADTHLLEERTGTARAVASVQELERGLGAVTARTSRLLQTPTIVADEHDGRDDDGIVPLRRRQGRRKLDVG